MLNSGGTVAHWKSQTVASQRTAALPYVALALLIAFAAFLGVARTVAAQDRDILGDTVASAVKEATGPVVKDKASKQPVAKPAPAPTKPPQQHAKNNSKAPDTRAVGTTVKAVKKTVDATSNTVREQTAPATNGKVVTSAVDKATAGVQGQTQKAQSGKRRDLSQDKQPHLAVAPKAESAEQPKTTKPAPAPSPSDQGTAGLVEKVLTSTQEATPPVKKAFAEVPDIKDAAVSAVKDAAPAPSSPTIEEPKLAEKVAEATSDVAPIPQIQVPQVKVPDIESTVAEVTAEVKQAVGALGETAVSALNDAGAGIPTLDVDATVDTVVTTVVTIVHETSANAPETVVDAVAGVVETATETDPLTVVTEEQAIQDGLKTVETVVTGTVDTVTEAGAPVLKLVDGLLEGPVHDLVTDPTAGLPVVPADLGPVEVVVPHDTPSPGYIVRDTPDAWGLPGGPDPVSSADTPEAGGQYVPGPAAPAQPDGPSPAGAPPPAPSVGTSITLPPPHPGPHALAPAAPTMGPGSQQDSVPPPSRAAPTVGILGVGTSTVPAPGAGGPDVALLALLTAMITSAWWVLIRQALQTPPGITPAVPVPPG